MGKSELFSHFAERFEVKRTQAREFFDAWVRRTSKRYGVEPAEVAPADRQIWQTSEGAVVVERQGAAVVVIEGLHDGVDAKALAKTL